MASKSKALEKREERVHKDLDGDGERGESAAHRKKVMGRLRGTQEIPSGGLKRSKVCARCASKGIKSCSH